MKTALFADLHANLQALDACIADARAQGAERFIVAGDLVTDGPSPAETVERVRELTPHVIQGNREDYIRRCHERLYPQGWYGCRQAAAIEWTHGRLSAQQYGYLMQLPEQLSLTLEDGITLRVVHGSPFSAYELMKPRVDMAPLRRAADAVTEQVLVYGHHHEQWSGIVNGMLLVNPGSLGMHFNPTHSAEYCLLWAEGGEVRIQHRLVPYDFDALMAELETSGLAAAAPVWTALSFEGIRAGHCYCLDFLWEAEQICPTTQRIEGIVPDPVWDELGNWWLGRLSTNDV